MKKKRYTEEQIIGFLREADTGMPVKDYAVITASRRRATTCGAASSAAWLMALEVETMPEKRAKRWSAPLFPTL